MRRSLILLALAAALNLFVIETVSAGNEDSVPPDTSSTRRLYNPPRVITPEGGADTDAEAPPPAKCDSCPGSGRARVGGGGGFVPGYVFANLEEINAKVSEMGISDLSERILIFGGKGYARIGHLIIGGAGYGGRTETSGIPDGSARYADVTIAYGGLILGLSHANADYEVTAGMLLGGGAITVERRRNSRYVVGWNDSWDPFSTDGSDSIDPEDLNITSTMVGDFIALEPFVEMKYWFLPFMAVDFSASYLRATIGKGEWTVDKVRIPDSPETNIGGPSLKLGIHFGV